jgi:hypothetical protein
MGKGLGKIAAQTAAIKDAAVTQAEMNQVNQIGPGGTTTYTQTGTSASGNPQYTVEQKLTPELQAIQDQKTKLAGSTLGNAQGTLQAPLNLGTGPTSQKVNLQTTAAGNTQLGTGFQGATQGTEFAGKGLMDPNFGSNYVAPQLNTTGFAAPQLGTGYGTAQIGTGFAGAELGTNFENSGLNTDFTQQGQDIIYDLGRERLDPRFQQEEAALEQQLANQGIRPGMEAYNRAKTQFAQQKNDAYTQLMMQGLETAAGISKDQFAAGLSQNQFNSSQLSNANQAKLLQAGITNEQLSLINAGKESQARLNNEQLQLVNQAKQEQAAATNSATAQANAAKQAQAAGQNTQQQLANQTIEQANAAKAQQAGLTNTQQQLTNEARAQQATLENQKLAQMNGAQLQQAQLDLQRQQQENAAALAQAQQNNDAAAQDRARQVQEQLATRQQAIQEAQAATTMGQVAPIGTVNTPQVGVQPVDAAGIMAGQQALQAQKQASLIGGIGSAVGALGSAAIMSDRRVKTDAKRVGKLDDGTPVHAYRYKGSPLMQIGVMAQDVAKTHPKAVSRNRRGLMAVDYGKLASEVRS